jgi:hypothetical protein
MTDLVTDLIIAQQRLDAFNASGVGKGRDIAHAFDAANKALRDEITSLRSALATAEAEIERLTEKAIVGEYMWTPVELGEAVATARKEALEEAARLIDSTPAKSNYAIYDHLAAAIRALAEKTEGDKP